jgi:hypothetical protein
MYISFAVGSHDRCAIVVVCCCINLKLLRLLYNEVYFTEFCGVYTNSTIQFAMESILSFVSREREKRQQKIIIATASDKE